MLNVISTKLYTGVEISGTLEDMKSFYDSIKKVLKAENGNKRIVKFCSKIRMGYKEENLYSQERVNYHFNILWPEVMFVVFSLEELLLKCSKNRFNKKIPYDAVIINYFKELVLKELKCVIGEVNFKKEEKKYYEKLFYGNKRFLFSGCYLQWIDIMNVNFIKAQPSERVEILSECFSWLVDRDNNVEYRIVQSEIWNYARFNKMNEQDVIIPEMEYVGEINW